MAQAMLDKMNSVIQSQSRTEQEQKDMAMLLSTFIENTDDQQNQSSSQDNNVVPKKNKRRSDYSSTKVKTRNFLANLSYRRFKQSDFNNGNFIVHILSLLVPNFNPINLDIKIEVEKERQMVKFMWDVCLPNEFVLFILKHENYNQISQPNLTYQKANNIVRNYIAEDPNRINHLKYKIAERFDQIHYIYSSLFSKIYNRTNTFGIQRKNDFDFQFQNWIRRKQQQKFDVAKDPSNYSERKIKKFEQAPIDFQINN